MILLVAGLQVGDVIKVPGDKIATAVDNLWNQGIFEDVQVLLSRIQDDKVFLKIVLRGRPKLAAVHFEGISGNDADKLGKEFDIHVGDVVTENVLKTTSNKAKAYYANKGFTNTEVTTKMLTDTSGKGNYVILNYNIKKGKRVKIDSLIIEGNERVATNKLLRKMKNTHDVHYGKKLFVWTKGFWSRSKYREFELNEDLEQVIAYYNELGYRDACILEDSVWTVDEKHVNVYVKLEEGERYYIRDITWVGNTVVTTDYLNRALGMQKGDVYNQKLMKKRLSEDEDAIGNYYWNNGYLFYQLEPTEVNIVGDSIDLEMRIQEGTQAHISHVRIFGNDRLYEEVVRRELRTKPGDLFSKDAIQRSAREISTTGFFDPEKAAEALAPLGFDVVKLPVNTDGIVDVDKARMLIDDSIGLVSVQLANNETGVLQPVRDLVELAHEHGAYFHCDAVQALGKMTIDLQELGVDSASFSAHKIHGPKGVGFIYIAPGSMKFPFVFAYKGGGQEHGLRPGTVNVPGIVGMATAMRMLPSDAKIHEMSELLRRFELGLVASGLPCVFHGDRAERLPNTSNFALCGIPADMLIANLPTLCISTGSACNSQEVAPSDVLKAMGVSDDEALSSIRVSLSTQTTEEEIDYAIMEISRATSRLKELLS